MPSGRLAASPPVRSAVVEPLVLRHGAAATVFEVALIVWAFGELVVRVRSRGGARASDDPTYWLLAVTMLLGFAGAFGFANLRATDITSSGSVWPVIVGLTLFGVGVGLRAWAVITLGRYFTYAISVQEGQRVVQTGPYRWLRHPSYTGLLLAFTGIGIALDNWLSLVSIVLIPLVGLIVRIWREEAALTSRLGDAYTSYSARTRRLVPGVW
jgi:protein-S-isoprenylcysteine O-methyltransferase Ste14